jgi:hypothetical protein
VSADWLRSIVPIIKRADLWQCGSNVIGANGGIVTYSLEKWKEPLVSPSVNGAKLEGLDGARIVANRPLDIAASLKWRTISARRIP